MKDFLDSGLHLNAPQRVWSSRTSSRSFSRQLHRKHFSTELPAVFYGDVLTVLTTTTADMTNSIVASFVALDYYF